MLNRRSALAVLGSTGIGTAVFQRALAARAGGGPVSPQMVADAEWVAGIKLTEPQREAVVNAFKFAREDLDHVRPIELDNSLLPGLRFAPFASPASLPDPRRYEVKKSRGTRPRTACTARLRRGFGVQFHSAARETVAPSTDFVGGIDEVVSATAPSLRPAAQMRRDLHGRAGTETGGAAPIRNCGPRTNAGRFTASPGASRTFSPIRATPRPGALGNIATA